ncbi:Uncharacterized protein HZ326_31150 [Fusarium oxysporum f. sp. albedinis]|nr:Uncharacterized protein HZ326_31150 [Fusarium oxysporum f. sp. albedinis]
MWPLFTSSYLTDLAAVPGLPTRASSVPALCITCYRLQNEAIFNLPLFKARLEIDRLIDLIDSISISINRSSWSIDIDRLIRNPSRSISYRSNL